MQRRYVRDVRAPKKNVDRYVVSNTRNQAYYKGYGGANRAAVRAGGVVQGVDVYVGRLYASRYGRALSSMSPGGHRALLQCQIKESVTTLLKVLLGGSLVFATPPVHVARHTVFVG